MQLYDEFINAAQVLNEAQIPYALVGGLAYTLYVEPRATEDIDFLIRPGDWDRVQVLFAPHNWVDLAGPMDFKNIRIPRLTKIEDIHVMVMNFLLADGNLERGLEAPRTFVYRDINIKAARPEVIVELKRGRMSDKDRIDIAGLEKLIESERM